MESNVKLDKSYSTNLNQIFYFVKRTLFFTIVNHICCQFLIQSMHCHQFKDTCCIYINYSTLQMWRALNAKAAIVVQFGVR